MDGRVTVQKLEVFCAVVELGGVSRAADQLYLSQPVVTAHVRALGRHLGAPLFERDGRHLKLTEAGETTYRWARDALTRAAELQRELGGLASGSHGAAVVAAGPTIGTYVLPPMLGRFCQQYPEAHVALDVLTQDQIHDAVRNGGCDFALTFAPEGLRGVDLIVEPVGVEELILVAAVDGPPIANKLSRDELKGLRFVGAPRDHARQTLIDRLVADAGVELGPVRLDLGNPEAAKRAIGGGAGVALLPRHAVADELLAGTLRQIEIDDVHIDLPINLVRRADRQLSPLQRALYDGMRAELHELLDPVAHGL
ncbi:MAG TPA: LysR family transcriptional regulator [Solirubrobacteraceae bacterium]|nr:LysR family transcriptional regulator [Solirubrobacteraceae bacterium]